MQENSSNGFFGQIIKSVILSITISLVLIIVFALVIRFTLIGEGVIKAINQFIKTLSLFFGCYVNVRSRAGLIKGLIIGVIYTLVINFLFMLFGANFVIDGTLVVDAFFMAIIGAISCIMAVNVCKSK